MNLMQQLTRELQDATEFMGKLKAQLAASQRREQALRQVADELFGIATPGALKNALWSKYRSIEKVTAAAQPAMDAEKIVGASLSLLATLPEDYPPCELSRDPEGLYSLTVGDTLIFHSKPATDALARVTRYVKERERCPTLPVGVVDGIYD